MPALPDFFTAPIQQQPVVQQQSTSVAPIQAPVSAAANQIPLELVRNLIGAGTTSAPSTNPSSSDGPNAGASLQASSPQGVRPDLIQSLRPPEPPVPELIQQVAMRLLLSALGVK